MVRWPGHVPADRVADHNVGTIDLYPTLCGLAGITPVKHVFGVTEANRRYLSAKQGWGHRIDDEDIGR